MRLFSVLVALVVAAPAYAGGFGVVGTGGIISDKVWFYDKSQAFLQYHETQILPTYGTGLEFVLGDRDDKICGVFRGMWFQDGSEHDPAAHTDQVSAGNVVSAVRDTPHNTGVGTFGLQWGFVGHPDHWQIAALTSVGSGFLTNDRTEFLLGEAGIGGTFRVNHNVELFANIDADMRYRKRFSWGQSTYLGARWLFD